MNLKFVTEFHTNIQIQRILTEYFSGITSAPQNMIIYNTIICDYLFTKVFIVQIPDITDKKEALPVVIVV